MRAAAASLGLVLMAGGALAQGAPTLPDPYGPPSRQWARPLDGHDWGTTAGIEIGPHGELWAIDRCGGAGCEGSRLPAVYLLDPKSGKALRGIGAGLFVLPHGLHVDRDGNVWVTDPAVSKDGTMGEQVVKMSPDGRVLMRLGLAGKSGGGSTMFHDPSDITTAPNGDIFVADGHGAVDPNLPPDTITRIIKFTPDGKFIKAWGSLGSGPGQFRNPHGLVFDSQGRLLVADRVNGRIQLFDQDGHYLTEWHDFGFPSGLYIDADDTLYAVDYNTEGRKGVWIGSAKTGKSVAFVPDDQAGEGVAVEADGTLYGATPHGVTRFLKKPAPAPAMLKQLATSADIQALIARAKATIKPGQTYVGQTIVALAPYDVSLDYRVLPVPPAIHEKQAELFYVIAGSGTLTVGGTLTDAKRTNAANLSGTAIQGGTDYALSQGDFYFVPEGVPHMWTPVGGPLIDMSLHLPRPVGN